MYKNVAQLSNEEDMTEEKRQKIMEKMKIFFGPTRKFMKVFKAALLFSVDSHKKGRKEKS
jgi:hypothetical protein